MKETEKNNIRPLSAYEIYSEIHSQIDSGIIDGEGELSAYTHYIVQGFLQKLWAAPEALVTAGFPLEEVVLLGHQLKSDLWECHVKIIENRSNEETTAESLSVCEFGGAERLRSMDLDEAERMSVIHSAMSSRIRAAAGPTEPFTLQYSWVILSPVCGDKAAFDAFHRYVHAEVKSEGRLKRAISSKQVEKQRQGQRQSPVLARHQQKTFDFCKDVGELFFSGRNPYKQFKIRSFPLIAGPTGAGKTHLVRELAQALGCYYARLDYGTWLPRGAKEDPNTLEFIGELALNHERVLIHLDELDKMRTNFSSGWEISIKNDIWRLLDRPIELNHLACAQSYESGEAAFAELFCQRVWIVGSGTWQEIFESQSQTIGFASAADSASVEQDAVDRIHKEQLVAPELVGRFNSKIQILNYPDVAEVGQLLEREELKLSEASLANLGERMQHSGFRAVEDVLTEHAIECMKKERVAALDDDPDTGSQSPVVAPEASPETVGPELHSKTFSVSPPRLEGSYLVRIRSQDETTVHLEWLHYCDGIDASGPTRCHRLLPHMEIWDDFADKWQLPPYQSISLEEFESWLPREADLEPTPEIGECPEALYDFWKFHHEVEAGRRESMQAVAARAEEIFQCFSRESQKRNPVRVRYPLAESLLSAEAGASNLDFLYRTPNLNQKREQCADYVNRGLLFLRSQLPDPFLWTEDMLKCAEDWERRLVEHIGKQAKHGDIVYQLLTCPPKIAATFNLIEPDLQWQDLSKPVRQRFDTLFESFVEEVPF